jgi:hypothetical protein
MPAAAQTAGEEPVEQPRFFLGPIGLTPTLAIRDIGVDTNVFRTAGAPERDFTATVGPGVNTVVRIGRAHVRLDSRLDWIYFQKFDHQRSFNVSERGRLDVDLVRLTPFVRGHYTRTRQRPNPELDVRVQQKLTGAGGGVAIRVGPSFLIEAAADAARVQIEDDEPEIAQFAAALNRRSHRATVAGRWRWTPLTTFVVKGDAGRDEFELSPLRDNRTFSVMPGVELRPLALISGHAFAGVKRFAADDAALPDYTGVVADVAVGWIVSDLMQFKVGVRRDVEYSFEALEPYFLLTDLSVEVRQALGYQWDVVGRAGLAQLAYRRLDSAGAAAAEGRRDWADLFGAGVGRRLGDRLRVGIDLDRVARRSPLPDREYQGFRIGGSFTYGY